MPVSVVKIASSGGRRSTAAATASGRIRSSGLSRTRAGPPEQRLRRGPGRRSRRCALVPLLGSRSRAFSRCARSAARSTSAAAARASVAPGVADEAGCDRRAAADVLGRARRAGSRSCPSGTSRGRGSRCRRMSSTSPSSIALARRRVADQPGLADLEGVVVLEPLLGLERQHHRGGEAVGQREHLGAGLAGAAPDEQRDRTSAPSSGGRGASTWASGAGAGRAAGDEAWRARALGERRGRRRRRAGSARRRRAPTSAALTACSSS